MIGLLPNSTFGKPVVSIAIVMILSILEAIGVAIFLIEIALGALNGITGTAIELLAVILSIIYGMWGLFYAVDLGQNIDPKDVVRKFPHLHQKSSNMLQYNQTITTTMDTSCQKS